MSVKDPSLKDGLTLTFQTRLDTLAAQDATLSAIAGLMSSIERGRRGASYMSGGVRDIHWLP